MANLTNKPSYAGATSVTFTVPTSVTFKLQGGYDDSTENKLDKSYENWLPSFNVRFGFTEKQFARFGYSKAISRPDFGRSGSTRRYGSARWPCYSVRGCSRVARAWRTRWRAAIGAAPQPG